VANFTAVRKTIFFLLFIIFQRSYSQTSISGTVHDASTKLPISYCAIAIQSSSKGTIANEEGDFRIIVRNVSDTLLLSFIGYKRREIPASTLLKNPLLELEPVNYKLAEVVVRGNDQYLYQLVDQCRKKIMSSAKHESKAYFLMQTDVSNSPAEMIECYYNATASGHALQQLLIKSGRIGLAETSEHGFFLSENTAHVLPMMDLVKEREGLPELPLQMTERKLKKIYDLSIEYSLADENTTHIKFFPKSDARKYFRGEAWIDNKTMDLLRIDLKIDSAVVHPFVSVWHEDELRNVSFSFSETFSRRKDSVVYPEHISFSYNLSYHANMAYRASELKSIGSSADTAERVQMIFTSGSLTFYDFDDKFYLPHYSYDEAATDYRKILSFPFNNDFWNHAPHLLYTEKQENAIDFFNANGVLINYAPNTAMRKVGQVAGDFFSGVNIFWSDTSRISLTHGGLETVLRKESLSKSLTFRSDQYHLETQIFFDISKEGDVLKHFSSSIFDVNKSFYNLPHEAFTDCFLNLFFDITESQRRKLEAKLDSNSYTVPQMDSLYFAAVNNLKQQQDTFIKETESGMNMKGLQKWNEYIVEMLGLDNMKRFGLK
jgi:hypothetical protein